MNWDAPNNGGYALQVNGAVRASGGTVNNLYASTMTFNDGTYMTSTTTFAAAGNYIQNTNTLQSGATFYVSSGTVAGNLIVGSTIAASHALYELRTSGPAATYRKPSFIPSSR